MPAKVAARPGFAAVPAVRDGFLREIKSPLILQPGPAALTDGLDALAGIIAEWAADGACTDFGSWVVGSARVEARWLWLANAFCVTTTRPGKVITGISQAIRRLIRFAALRSSCPTSERRIVETTK